MEYIIGTIGVICVVVGILTVLASKDELEKLQRRNDELERKNLYLSLQLKKRKVNMEA